MRTVIGCPAARPGQGDALRRVEHCRHTAEPQIVAYGCIA